MENTADVMDADVRSVSPVVFIERGDFLSGLLHKPLILDPWLKQQEQKDELYRYSAAV